MELIGRLVRRSSANLRPGRDGQRPPHPAGDLEYCQSSYEAAEGADAAVIVTEWNEFKLLNMDRIKTLMKLPIIFDGRNIYDPVKLRRMGFEYHCIGRTTAAPK